MKKDNKKATSWKDVIRSTDMGEERDEALLKEFLKEVEGGNEAALCAHSLWLQLYEDEYKYREDVNPPALSGIHPGFQWRILALALRDIDTYRKVRKVLLREGRTLPEDKEG